MQPLHLGTQKIMETARNMESNFFTKEIICRVSLVGIFLLVPVSTGIEAISGVVSGAAATLCGGKFSMLNRVTVEHFRETVCMPYNLFCVLLAIINPHAEIYSDDETSFFSRTSDHEMRGFVASFLSPKLQKIAEKCLLSEYMITQHVFSRIVYGALLVVSVVGRLFDAILSVPAVIGSILTLGMVMPLNNIAMRTNQSLMVVCDVFYYTIKMINPSFTLHSGD